MPVDGILYSWQVQGSWRNTAGFLFALNVTLLISSAIQVTLHMPGKEKACLNASTRM
jgi:hypothetical protein